MTPGNMAATWREVKRPAPRQSLVKVFMPTGSLIALQFGVSYEKSMCLNLCAYLELFNLTP